MKVLILAPGGAPIPATKGGAVECLIEYLIKENEKEHEIDLSIISPYEKSAEEISKSFSHCRCYYIRYPFFIDWLDSLFYVFAKYILRKKKVITYKLFFKRLWNVLIIRSIIRKKDFDIIVLENHVSLLLVFKNKKIKKKYEGKIIYHEHNIISNTVGCDEILFGCQKIITVSDYISRDLLSRFPKINSRKVVKLPNVADMDMFGKVDNEFLSSFYAKYSISPDSRIIMFAGRLDPTKGVREVIEAYNIITKNGRAQNTVLVIVGSYAYSLKCSDGFDKELRMIANGNNIVFTGYIDFRKMPSLYKAAYITVLPSIWDDPAPLSIIEALSSGSALITTNSGGIPEYAYGSAIILERDEKLVYNISTYLDKLLHDDEFHDELCKKALTKTANWNCKTYYEGFVSIIHKRIEN